MEHRPEGPMENPSLEYEEGKALAAQASKVFQPRTPITTKELFAGRWNELTTVADAVNQTGLHVVIYGERGVGKTSLANVVWATIWALDADGKDPATVPERLVLKAVANSNDTFSSIWDRLFADLTWEQERSTIGLLNGGHPKQRTSIREAFAIAEDFTVNDVRRILSNLPGSVFIIDEFDRAPRGASTVFTDLIKTLSDLGTASTVILVGVSDTVDSLIADHASINRAVIQVQVQRMKPAELTAILHKAETALGVKFSEDAKNLVVRVSQGLPHYTHLIGLNAVRLAATEKWTRHIGHGEVFQALKNAVKQAEQTVTQRHSTATHSAHKDALYRHVLLACALAAARSQDAQGFFNPSSVVSPLGQILKRDVTIATFSNHLTEFCQPKRGEALERDGQPWGYRYRFHDPLLVPYVFMNAVEGGLITGEDLRKALEEEG